ncbi:Type I secretion system membrane fusion protein PrsE [Roseivivax jejudonensis]|uniref:Membrane fusion protein (MFP) family protein n=1 Tax=Roseivivax jejudonensis TaxID=1529041 RepID=A0A1X6YWQ1_9RHOB|nr:HlyD family type I secretion periplasmic adaptor subunit [Roseivivax jejudonensis]SLN33327.1 Type I secretion system membrane fusion protein PrsE [Roseivivax jejudonensis]
MTQTAKSSRKFRSTVPMLVGFTTVFVLIGALGAWAMRTEIAGAVVASGRIVVEKNRQVVQHLDGGIVDEILVREGDQVEEGALLARLDPTLIQSELTIIEGQLFEVMARNDRLQSELSETETVSFDQVLEEEAETRPEVAGIMQGQERLFRARLDTLERSVTQLQNQRLQLEKQITGIDAQATALERQRELIGEETTSQQTLYERGLAQASRLLGLQREEARLAGQIGELEASRAQAMERIAELEIEELSLHAQRREDAITQLRDMEFREMEMAERRTALIEQLSRMDIRAPVGGVIYDLRVFGASSVIRPADPVMYIVPQDRPLIIEARVDPINVDEVYTGQEVMLRVAAFDMRDVPDLFGEVIQVSADAFTDEQTGASFYRARIQLPETELDKLPEGQVLVPGMPVDAFIRTQDRTPAAYLMSPLTRYFDKAFRDG